MAKDSEIVGLKGTGNGRSCISPVLCGEHVKLDDLVQLRLSVPDIDGKIEQAMQVVLIQDGTESSAIGFLPRNIVKSRKEKVIGKFVQIIELDEYSESRMKHRKSHQNKGVAYFCLLDDILQQE